MSAHHGRWEYQRGRHVWIDHQIVRRSEVELLVGARSMALWNVRVPNDFYARLPNLRLLDLRGGSAENLEPITLAPLLKGLVVNQVRGLRDLSALTRLKDLEILSLYGIPGVTRLPSLADLRRLRRVELGQMRDLNDLSTLAAAPALEELYLSRKLDITVDSMKPLQGHPTLRAFDWFWEDVPASRALPVLNALPLPDPPLMRPEDWFDSFVIQD
jgi:hypothetical protein